MAILPRFKSCRNLDVQVRALTATVRNMEICPMRQLATILLVLALGPMTAFAAGTRVCTADEAQKAEAVSDRATSWEQLYRQFRQFAHCDDGAIAEGFSESNTLLLANHWGTIRQMEPMIASDPAFRKFIIRHVDATVPAERLLRIARNAGKQCPRNLKSFCQDIQEAAKK